MKKNHLKSIIAMLLTGLLLTVFAPTNTFAQKKNRKNKHKKEQVKKNIPVKQYKKYPRRGAHVTTIPKNSKVITYRTNKYHYDNGIFYRPVNGNYVVARPPVGIRISVLPPNPYRVILSGHTYYYHYGTYYLPYVSGGYEVVDAPVGARIDALPDGYEIFEIDSRVYYRLDDNYYKAVVEPNGNVVYEVVRV